MPQPCPAEYPIHTLTDTVFDLISFNFFKIIYPILEIFWILISWLHQNIHMRAHLDNHSVMMPTIW